MSEVTGTKKHTFDLTDEEIAVFDRYDAEYWANRVMTRLWKLFRDDRQQYDYWANQLVTQGKTLSGWKTFLKDAVHKLREMLTPNLMAV